MTNSMREVLLIGFGAVGAIYSLIIKRGGLARVTAVARSNYDIIQREGMHFQSQKYGRIEGWRPDRLCRSVAEAANRPYDYVFVTTKAIPELLRTPVLLAPFLQPAYSDAYPQPTYVIIQNGLNVERDMYEALHNLGKGTPKIIGTALYIGTNLLKSNIVEHNGFDRLAIGVYRHNDYTTTENSPEDAALLGDLSSVLTAGGGTVKIVPEIQRTKFSKNFWNVAFSSFATLTSYPLPAIFRSPPQVGESYEPYVSTLTSSLVQDHTIPAIRAVLMELVALGRAMGFPDTEDGLPSSIADMTIENTAALHHRADSTHRPSMLLDVERGQPIEVEVIIGEVVRLAKKFQVDIPRIELLYALLLVVQNQILRKRGSGE